MGQVNIPGQLLGDGTSALGNALTGDDGFRRTDDCQRIESMVLVEPLVLNTDKCLFYRVRNFI